ncbi:hypothetical protein, partial [Escherichia coli]|uniref:hypothetical protein n=5 Tax=Escherichia coli TaxID=562 RepID=UPI001BDB862E
MFEKAHLTVRDDAILSTSRTGFLLPVANNCKHSQFAKRNCDVDNIFTPEHRQGRLVELSAAVRFLRGIHFIKITAR